MSKPRPKSRSGQNLHPKITLRAPQEELDSWREAAALVGQTFAAWARDLLRAGAMVVNPLQRPREISAEPQRVTKVRKPRAVRPFRASNMTRERAALYSAIERCSNAAGKSYKNYGGRGIGVHPDWMGKDGAERFLSHIGPRPTPHHSLDRIDNDRGYEPGNVRWATKIEQRRNTSRPGRPDLPRGSFLVDHAKPAGIHRDTLASRLGRGMSLDLALTTPVKKTRPKPRAKS